MSEKPFKVANQYDDDVDQAVRGWMHEHEQTGDEGLLAMIRALLDHHKAEQDKYPGAMPMTLLQLLELLVDGQAQRHEANHNRCVTGEVSHAEYIQAGLDLQLGQRQRALAQLLRDCMAVIGARPFRRAM